MEIANCNRCDRSCPYSYKFKLGSGKVIIRRGMMKNERSRCKLHQPPREGWKLVELALANPTGLNEVLKELPFDVNIGMYL